MAARGARAAARPDAADRRADGLAGERSGSPIRARSVRPRASEIGLVRRPQFADRYSLGEPRRSGVDASIREGTRRVTARPHSFAQHSSHRRAAALSDLIGIPGTIIVVSTLTLATIPFAFLLKDPRRTASV